MAETNCYEFGPFRLDTGRQVLLRNGEPVHITAQSCELLDILIQNRGHMVSKEVLMNQMWPGSVAAENSLRVTIRAIRKALGVSAKDREYIVTASGRYSFVADVRPGAPGCSPPSLISETEASEVPSSAAPNIHPPLSSSLHQHLACTLYGSLFGLVLVIETAYEFDKYKSLAFILAPLVSVLGYFTSLIGLRVARQYAERGSRVGLAVAVCIFIGAGLALFFCVAPFLPAIPVTQQTTQSAPAQSAYLKCVVYHLFVVLPFLVIPFYFISAVQRELQAGERLSVLRLLSGSRRAIAPRGAIYIRLWALFSLLLFYMYYAARAHHSLASTLTPGPYMNLFTLLLWVRLAILFGLAIECLIWYYWALNEMKRESLLRANLGINV